MDTYLPRAREVKATSPGSLQHPLQSIGPPLSIGSKDCPFGDEKLYPMRIRGDRKDYSIKHREPTVL